MGPGIAVAMIVLIGVVAFPILWLRRWEKRQAEMIKELRQWKETTRRE